jgi:hypothetical protein
MSSQKGSVNWSDSSSELRRNDVIGKPAEARREVTV